MKDVAGMNVTSSQFSATEACLARRAQLSSPGNFLEQSSYMETFVPKSGKGDMRIAPKTPQQMEAFYEEAKTRKRLSVLVPGSACARASAGIDGQDTKRGPVCKTCHKSRAKGSNHPRICPEARQSDAVPVSAPEETQDAWTGSNSAAAVLASIASPPSQVRLRS